MGTQEEQWAIALKKARQQSRHANEIPLGIQKGQIEEQMQYQKNLLEQAVFTQNIPVRNAALDRLIELRGKQTAVALKELHELFGAIATPALESEIRQYYADCKNLIAATEAGQER